MSKIPGRRTKCQTLKRPWERRVRKMAKWKGISRPKSTTMDLVIGIGKELMALFEE